MYRRYGNSKSGVTAYRIEKEAIDVVFTDMVYRYSYKAPGKTHVEKMKKLAQEGIGLSTYISQKIRNDYEGKHPLGKKRQSKNT